MITARSESAIHRGLRLYVRPVRLAVAIEPGDGWISRARSCLIALAETWGGGSSIVVGGNDYPPWKRRMLQAHDPDYVATFIPTVLTLFPRYSDEAKAGDWIRTHAQDLVDNHSIPQDQAESLAKDRLQQPISDWRIANAMAQQCERTLSLLDPTGHPHVTLEGSPWEYVSMSHVDRGDNPPLHVVEPPIRDPFLELLIAFRIGDLTPKYAESESGRSAKPLRHDVDSSDLELFLRYLWTGTVDDSFLSLTAAYAEAQGGSFTIPTWATDEAVGNSPMARSAHGLVELVPRQSRFSDDSPLVIVVGDSIEDFCLAVSWERLYGLGSAMWMPRRWMAGRTRISRAARSALRSLTSSFLVKSDDRKAVVTSVSLERRSLASYIGVIRRDQMLYPDRINSAEVESLDFSTPPRRWSDSDIWDRYSGSTWLGDTQLDRINTPLPTHVRTSEVSQLSWQVDVLVDRYLAPPRAGLATLLTAPEIQLGSYAIRASSNGISYRAQSAFVEAGAPLDRSLLFPRLRTPNTQEIFQALAERAQLSVALSSAGGFMRATLNKWGGLDALARDMSEPGRRALISAFHHQKESDQGVESETPGLWLDHTKRRYLTFDDALRVSELSAHELRAWIDELGQREVLTRGLALHCQVCRLAAWYPMRSIGAQFACARCRERLHVSQPSWKDPLSEPNFYYELAEVVYQGTAGDFAAIILTLDHIASGSRAFDFTPQLDVFAGDNLLGDLDINAVADGRIYIGEAKSVDRLGDSENKERQVLNRLHRVAGALSADVVVLATSAPRWRRQTMELVEEKLDASQYDIDLREGVGN